MADIPADIIIYALIAGGLIFWLRSILGTRHGDERTRSNPFVTPGDKSSENPAQQSPSAHITGEDEALPPIDLYNPFQDEKLIPDADVRDTLQKLVLRDPSFDPKTFLRNAEDAFIIIVEAFAAGDREELKPLLDKSVYEAFDRAITEREALGHKVINDVQAIRNVKITDAKLEGNMVYITVSLHVEETTVTRDADGTILSGNPHRTSEVIDIWTFGRKLRSKDPVWYLLETREGAPEAEDIESSPVPETGDGDKS